MKHLLVFPIFSAIILSFLFVANGVVARNSNAAGEYLSTNEPPTAAPSPTLPPITHPPVPTPHPCEGQIPAVPKLKSPADGATVQSDYITLQWSKAKCALRFRIRIREDRTDDKTIWAFKDWIGTKLELTHLKPGKYRWRVTGCFHDVCGKRSSVHHFSLVP
jgi:hypothetical protein